MTYKKFRMISICSYIVVVILSEVLIYYLVGEATLEQPGFWHYFSLWLPALLLLVQTLAEIIFQKKHKKGEDDK